MATVIEQSDYVKAEEILEQAEGHIRKLRDAISKLRQVTTTKEQKTDRCGAEVRFETEKERGG